MILLQLVVSNQFELTSRKFSGTKKQRSFTDLSGAQVDTQVDTNDGLASSPERGLVRSPFGQNGCANPAVCGRKLRILGSQHTQQSG